MMRKILLTIVVSTMFILSGCGMISNIFPPAGDRLGNNGGPDEGSANRAIREVDGLELVLQTTKASYPAGEPVPLKFKVINNGSEAVEFTFSSGQKFDFLVKHDGKVIWRWSFGKQFIQVFSQITLEADQAVTYEVGWPQVDNMGNPVPAGEYEALALLTAIEPLESGALIIQILDNS